MTRVERAAATTPARLPKNIVTRTQQANKAGKPIPASPHVKSPATPRTKQIATRTAARIENGRRWFRESRAQHEHVHEDLEGHHCMPANREGPGK